MTTEIEESSTFAQVVGDNDGVVKEIIDSGFGHIAGKTKLPTLYCTVKMHKEPISFRFITAGRDTILQHLSVAVGKSLKALLNTAKISEHYRIKDIDNCIFIIDNRDIVIKFLNRANIETKKGRKHISSWDFTTLYTKIPHDNLKEVMARFISRVFFCLSQFKNPKDYICYSPAMKKAYYSKNRSKSNICFNENELITAVNYIIEHSYVNFHDRIFRQIVGIPMGTNCAPFIANIYLHIYEYEYLLKLIQQGELNTAKLLSKTFRYQDDCIAVNDDGVFSQHFSQMYDGSKMELKPTNISRDKCTFLDLNISIYRGKFLYRSYDKRDDFNFTVVNYPNLHGNIPSSQSYGVYISQLVRFCDINKSLKYFVSDIAKLTSTLINQGFDKAVLRSRYNRFCTQYVYKWAKYNTNIHSPTVMNKIFPS